jgi:PAS domain S-box-containing protein
LPQNQAFDDFPAIGPKVMLLNARKLRHEEAELILLAIEDVTAQRRADAEWQDIESRFTSLVKNVKGHSNFSLDPEGRVTSWNVAAEHVLGYPEAEVLDRLFAFIFTPEDRQQGLSEAELRTAREHGRAEDERWHLRKGGERFWALGVVTALRDAEGRPIGFFKILPDMTEWKRSEEALRESERQHRILFDSVDEGVCLFERLPLRPDRLRDYHYITMNPAMQAMFGVPDLSGQSIRDNFPDEVEDWYDDYDRVLETGRPILFECETVAQGKVLEMFVARVEDVSRISRGKIHLRNERVRVAAIIDAALEMSDSGLSRGNRRLAVSVPPEPLPVEGDRVRLVQVVSNLLNNAVKATDEGGQITVRAVPQGDGVEIQVQDDGRGIPRERLTDIFEMFSQIEPGRGGGLGIGLKLVRSLVALHGGSVFAASDGPGRGATFTVSLPLCRGPAPARSSDASATDPMPGRRVLVVDDSRDIADGLRLLLSTPKADVRVAYDGAEALRICEEWAPTHVLMDLGMSVMDGYEAARRLRANHPDLAFRLVAVSGGDQDEHRQRAREAGFDQHLTKPVRVADLKAILSG